MPRSHSAPLLLLAVACAPAPAPPSTSPRSNPTSPSQEAGPAPSSADAGVEPARRIDKQTERALLDRALKVAEVVNAAREKHGYVRARNAQYEACVGKCADTCRTSQGRVSELGAGLECVIACQDDSCQASGPVLIWSAIAGSIHELERVQRALKQRDVPAVTAAIEDAEQRAKILGVLARHAGDSPAPRATPAPAPAPTAPATPTPSPPAGGCGDPDACKRACDGGDAEVCWKLGKDAKDGATGQGGDMGALMAWRYWTKACGANHADACNAVGYLYASGEGMKRSFIAAKAFMTRACQLSGERGHCANAQGAKCVVDTLAKARRKPSLDPYCNPRAGRPGRGPIKAYAPEDPGANITADACFDAMRTIGCTGINVASKGASAYCCREP